MSREQDRIEEMAMTPLDVLANDIYQHCPDLKDNYCGDTHCVACLANALYNAGYRKQSEGENYKELYEQLLEDFKFVLYYAGKNNNVCNFCEHDCGEGGTCKGREDWFNCNPKWRGIVKGGE